MSSTGTSSSAAAGPVEIDDVELLMNELGLREKTWMTWFLMRILHNQSLLDGLPLLGSFAPKPIANIGSSGI